jgi:hypothetical protein
MKFKSRYQKNYEKFYREKRVQGAEIKSLSDSNYIYNSKRIIAEQRRLENGSRNYISNLEYRNAIISR